MATWFPLFALPNVEVKPPIEVDGFALVSARDVRIQELADAHPNFGEFLNRFTTKFGQPIVPSVFICRADIPVSYQSIDAIAGFRDAIAMSVIPQSWARVFRYDNNMGVKYSDYFAVYPWMVDNNFGTLLAETLNVRSLHLVSQLRAQSTPTLSPDIVDAGDLDKPLLEGLLDRWQRSFSASTPLSDDIKLFRSLNMANAAALLPAGADVTMLDIGRSVALWSSAFEILAPAKRLAYQEVCALLNKTTWRYTPCKELKYEAYGFKEDRTLRNLPCWVFGAINHARNDYLHGNPIDRNRLIVAPAKRPLHYYAPLLYRQALAAFIDLQHVPSAKGDDDNETEYQTYRRDQHVFGHYQGDIEVALSSIMYTADEWRAGVHRQAGKK
jgi:hypothetical protein